MSTEKNDNVSIKCIVDRAKDISGKTTDRELSEIIGISSADFGNRKKRGTLLPLLIKWAANENVDLNYLIKGKEREKTEERPTKKFLLLVDQWLTELITSDPGRSDWFKYNFIDAFPRFEVWLNAKETEAKKERKAA